MIWKVVLVGVGSVVGLVGVAWFARRSWKARQSAQGAPGVPKVSLESVGDSNGMKDFLEAQEWARAVALKEAQARLWARRQREADVEMVTVIEAVGKELAWYRELSGALVELPVVVKPLRKPWEDFGELKVPLGELVRVKLAG